MKIAKTLSVLFICLSIFTAIISCTQEPMFYDVSRETKLLEKKVEGIIYNIIEYQGYLYAAGGKIWKKDKTAVRNNNDSTWSEVTTRPIDNDLYTPIDPELKAMVLRLANGDNASSVYAMSIQGQTLDEDIPGTFFMHKAVFDTEGNITEWADIATPENYLLKNIISDGKNAYAILNTDGADDLAFEIKNGAVDTSVICATGSSSVTSTKSITSFVEIQGVASCNGKQYFSKISSKNNATAPCVTQNKDYTIIYKAETGKLSYSTDAENFTDISHEGFIAPYSLASYEFGSEKKLLVGTAYGYYEVTLNADGTIPSTAKDTGPETPQNNYGVTIATHYTMGIFAFDDSIGAIYAAMYEYNSDYGSKYNALWAFYPGRKRNGELAEWNCE